MYLKILAELNPYAILRSLKLVENSFIVRKTQCTFLKHCSS